LKYRLPSKGSVTHLVIDATGLKIFGEGEWKQRKHGKSQRRVWRKLHLAVDAHTHEVIVAEVSLENVADNEVLPTLLIRFDAGCIRYRAMVLTIPRSAISYCAEKVAKRPLHPARMPAIGMKEIRGTRPLLRWNLK
jgi:hypothetical protein